TVEREQQVVGRRALVVPTGESPVVGDRVRVARERQERHGLRVVGREPIGRDDLVTDRQARVTDDVTIGADVGPGAERSDHVAQRRFLKAFVVGGIEARQRHENRGPRWIVRRDLERGLLQLGRGGHELELDRCGRARRYYERQRLAARKRERRRVVA